MTTAAHIARAFPAPKDPQLPTADRLRRLILNELGEVASADVRLCVGPDGSVRDVKLVRGTSLPEFNDAVLRDVADWQFSGMPGSSDAPKLQGCEVATISYRPHQ